MSDTTRFDPTDRLDDPGTLTTSEDVTATTETNRHEDRDHCGTELAGRAVAGVTNADGDVLVLSADEVGVALLPHGRVEPGDDWTEAAHAGVEGQTGIAVSLDSVEAVRTVDHIVDDVSHTTTHRVIYSASPAGGEIRDCKRSADAGTDGFRAVWIGALPDDVEAPEGGPRNDLEVFLDA